MAINNGLLGETNSLFSHTYLSNQLFRQGFFAGKNLNDILQSDPNFSPPSIDSVARTLHLPQYLKMESRMAAGNRSQHLGKCRLLWPSSDSRMGCESQRKCLLPPWRLGLAIRRT